MESKHFVAIFGGAVAGSEAAYQLAQSGIYVVVFEQNFYYQNPFVYWYNHCHDPNGNNSIYKIRDNTIIVGGGLVFQDTIVKNNQLEYDRNTRDFVYASAVISSIGSIAEPITGIKVRSGLFEIEE